MLRWLLSIVGAIAVLLIAIILLGLLLKSGQEETAQLIIELEQQEQINQSSKASNTKTSSDLTVDKKARTYQPKNNLLGIQLRNQQCQHNNDCKLIEVERSLGCVLALNNTGYEQLSAAEQNRVRQAGCDNESYVAQCQSAKCEKIAAPN